MPRLLPRPLAFLSVIPFLLLTASENVDIHTTVYLDGSAQRNVSVEYKPSRQEDLPSELREVLPHAEVADLEVVGDLKRAFRGAIWGSPHEHEGLTLEVVDVLHDPLSFYTTYRWEEEVSLPSSSATPAELADPSRATFTYTVEMPGELTSTRVRAGELTVPPDEEAAEAAPLPVVTPAVEEANSASWALTGEYQSYTLTAESRRVRWGFLAVVLYILAFIVYRIVAFISYRARMRPRRI